MLLCAEGKSCIHPGDKAIERHLRKHGAKGSDLQALIHKLSEQAVLPAAAPRTQWPTQAIKGLALHSGFQCILGCSEAYITLEKVKVHIAEQHAQAQREAGDALLWQPCDMQTFYSDNQHRRYFPVHAAASGPAGSLDVPLAEEAFFAALWKDQQQAKQDALAAAQRIQDFGAHHSAVVPWLQRTGIHRHLVGLKKDDIHASYALPKACKTKEEVLLGRITDALEDVLRETHTWCTSEWSTKLTWQRQLALSNFRTAETGTKMRAWDPVKAPDTLAKYYRVCKQLMVYYFRTVHQETAHFSAAEEDHSVPEEVITPSSEQLFAWDLVMEESSNASCHAALKDAVLSFCMTLITHDTGSQPFSSALLSFAAMHALEAKSGAWQPAGNFSSFLSGLIWVAQLIIFRSAVDDYQSDAEVLATIKGSIAAYMQPDKETVFGEVLNWRLLCMQIAREEIGPQQAYWDEDMRGVTYKAVHLRLDQVHSLFAHQMRRARHLLFSELMFGAHGPTAVHASALQDSLDRRDVNWFFGKSEENADVLGDASQALVQCLQRAPLLAGAYLDKRAVPYKWCSSAVQMYQEHADQFLCALAVLIHMTSGQPLREPELFSIQWRNTQQKRNIGIKDGRVLIHTWYHKNQQQTSHHKHNVRFLHAQVGDLLVNYLVYVVPLLEVFLRASKPHALVSEYLWTKENSQRTACPSAWRLRACYLAHLRCALPTGVKSPSALSRRWCQR